MSGFFSKKILDRLKIKKNLDIKTVVFTGTQCLNHTYLMNL